MPSFKIKINSDLLLKTSLRRNSSLNHFLTSALLFYRNISNSNCIQGFGFWCTYVGHQSWLPFPPFPECTLQLQSSNSSILAAVIHSYNLEKSFPDIIPSAALFTEITCQQISYVLKCYDLGPLNSIQGNDRKQTPQHFRNISYPRKQMN